MVKQPAGPGLCTLVLRTAAVAALWADGAAARGEGHGRRAAEATVQLELLDKGHLHVWHNQSLESTRAVASKKRSAQLQQQSISTDISDSRGLDNTSEPNSTQTFVLLRSEKPQDEQWRQLQQRRAILLDLLISQGLRCFNALLAVAACVLIYFARVRPGPRGTAGSRRCWPGVENSFQIAVFAAYVIFSCTHMFLQRRAGSTGYSVISATIVIYAVKCLCAFFMYVCKGGRDFMALLEPTGGPRFGRVPTCLLTLVPGGCLGCYDALSFMSLAALDPVTYQIVLHMRLVLIALLWQFTFKRQLTATQWFALLLFAVASTTKGVEQVKELGVAVQRGLHIAFVQIVMAVSGNVMAECLLKEVPVHTDLLNTCLYLQGLAVLLVVVCVTHGGPAAVHAVLLAPAAWKELVADPWMLSSILCMAIFGIVTAYFLRELSNLLKELSACFVIISSAVVEWGVLGSSSCTMLGVQAVVLAILAVGVYNAEPLESRKEVAVRKG
mmetsp:Transcript_47186/g.109117  ORF Transcript_47186/g.109117 Transcript_47186/m.109117 type:complete len:498 (-) Transcript_47186:66-1559(-)|eukprot:CAMPEP_0171105438 /NCGR_PEP_ID=MMETSP0766_2-20121228/62681_1 /TAXON_ID=439317 /ORGANISM="Gambierdiscus australes, Strain CAWD 149" /LENGTH=497 /DNA_ID=CAMNT_0011566291 /DNA_START=99 /DNA_END=1592 /DNA_ORIENTATION=-